MADFVLKLTGGLPDSLPLIFSRGADRTITVATGLDLTGAVLQWVVKVSDANADVDELVTLDNGQVGGITILDPASDGIISLTFPHALFANHTTYLAAPVPKLIQACKVWLQGGQEVNLWEGPLSVRDFGIQTNTAPPLVSVSLPSYVPAALGAYRPRRAPFSPQQDTALAYSGLVGHPPALLHRFQDLVHPLESNAPTDWFAPAWATEARTNGIKDGSNNPLCLPVISWELDDYTQGITQPAYNNASFSAGTHDTAMGLFLTAGATWAHPFILVPFWEMTGSFYPWAAGANGNTPATFIAAWRHIYMLIKTAAPQALVCWCPSVDIPNAQLIPLEQCWPGDAFVDVIGLDGYNKGTAASDQRGAFWSFLQVFQASYRRVMALTSNPAKAVLVKETGCDPTGGDKAAWIAAIPAALALMPNIRGVCWFDNTNGPQDYRFSADSAILTAYSALAGQSALQGAFPTS